MSHNPSILMITGEYPPGLGGVGDYTALLSRQLVQSGARVTVFTTLNRDPRAERGCKGDPEVIRSARSWGFSTWPRIVAAARQCGAEVVHIQYQAAAYTMHPAANLLPSYLRARLPRVKVATTFHDLRVPYLFPKAGGLRGGAILALDALSHATVVTNQADLEKLGGTGRSAPPRRWLIPIGSNVSNTPPPDFERDHWRRQVGATNNTMTVSYFGFMNDTKGVEFLVQALGLLAARRVELRLLIVGGETGDTDPTNQRYYQRIVRLIESRHLQDKVYWTGFISGEQVSAALLSSDLCALPFRDGASLRRGSLLAALTHGLPTVTTWPEGPEPMLVNGENVIMVEKDSPSALAAALEQLWLDPDTRNRLAMGARKLAESFQWPNIAARHMGMYEALLWK